MNKVAFLVFSFFILSWSWADTTCSDLHISETTSPVIVTNSKGAIVSSPDGQLLLMSENNRTYLLNLNTNKQITILPNAESSYGVFSPDNKYVAVYNRNSNSEITLFNILTKISVKKSDVGDWMSENPRFSNSGRYFYWIGSGRESVYLLDLQTGKEFKYVHGQDRYGGTNTVYGIAFSPDESFAATRAFDSKTFLIDLKSKQSKTILGFAMYAWFSNDGSFLNLGKSVIDLKTGEKVQFDPSIDPTRIDSSLTKFSEDGKFLVVVDGKSNSDSPYDVEKKLSLIELSSGKIISQIVIDKGTNQLTVSSDGQWVALKNYNKQAVIVNLKTKVFTQFTEEVDYYGFNFSADSVYASIVLKDRTILTIELSSGKQTIIKPKGAYFRLADFSIFSNFFLVKILNESLFDIYDLRTGESIFSLTDVSGSVFEKAPGEYHLVRSGRDMVKLVLDCKRK